MASIPSPRFPRPAARAGAIALGVLGVAALAWVAVAEGPRAHAARELAMAAAAEAESQTVCQRLGIPAASERYSACASELGWVRRQHGDRLEARSAGLL
jgi:hypothetical protein